jgi:glutamyl-tRNA synthetase/glutamyl-Q tRNA(Asp) synthetase
MEDRGRHCVGSGITADSRVVSPAPTQADRTTLRARLAASLQPGWRTRFAPAPTGHLHLGHAVNAVYVWSIAQAFGGSVIVRIEDHDRQRARDSFETAIHDELRWLGLSGDNTALGLPAVVRQSDTPTRYTTALAQLMASRHVYPCRCSRRDIAANTPSDAELRYPGTCRHADVPPAETPARRVHLGDDIVDFEDLRHGVVSQQPSAQCGDLLIRDRLAQWTYQFAVVVDDAAHGIDLIIRGDDLLNSTGRQLLLAEALGRRHRPQLLHHPLLLHPDGTKLSKSRGDSGLAELRAAGWDANRILGEAAWLGGLQDRSHPLQATQLGRLWTTTDRPA